MGEYEASGPSCVLNVPYWIRKNCNRTSSFTFHLYHQLSLRCNLHCVWQGICQNEKKKTKKQKESLPLFIFSFSLSSSFLSFLLSFFYYLFVQLSFLLSCSTFWSGYSLHTSPGRRQNQKSLLQIRRQNSQLCLDHSLRRTYLKAGDCLRTILADVRVKELAFGGTAAPYCHSPWGISFPPIQFLADPRTWHLHSNRLRMSPWWRVEGLYKSRTHKYEPL